jgi:VWFA-related protein
MLHPWLAIGLMLSLALVAADGSQMPGVPSRVEVVRVDVTVTDRQGCPVPDLTADDFEIREDESPRTITNFTYVVVGASAPAPAAKPPTGGAPSTRPVGPPPARARQRRVLAFVVDDLNLSRTSMARTRDMLRRFVQKSLQPDDLVGLFRTGAAPSTVTLGADGAALLAEIAGLKWNSRSGRERPVDPIQKGLTAPITIGQDLDGRRAFLLAAASLGALQSVMRGLEPLGGRQTVVFVSDGLKVGRSLSDGLGGGRSTSAFDRLMDTANGANRNSLVVYTLDPRGVTPLNMEADDFDNDEGAHWSIPAFLDERAVSYGTDHDGLERLAEATGGLFVHDSDPSRGLAHALLDQSGYYLLGYEAPAGKEPRFHRVSVTVKRPGLRVRARSGYWSGR